MLRIIIAASALALAAAPALAQDGPRLSGSGDNAVVTYDGQPPGSVVGGGTVRMTGSGNDTRFTYGPVDAQPGRVARLTGSREDAEVTYAPDAAATRGYAATGRTSRGG
jgi:hypothetical protein